MTDLKEKLLKDINAGDVAMTPRLYFTLHWLGLIATAGAVLIVSVFLFNFLFFSIRINSSGAFLAFGPRGIMPFLHFFPWHLLISDIALIIILQYLLRKFRFGYRIPMLYFAGGLLATGLVLGFILDQTRMNDRLHEGRDHLPPPMRGLYEGAHKPPPQGSGVCRCTILAIEGNTLTVEDTRNATATLTIILPPDDRRATTSGLKIGDTVFIAGEEADGVIHAFGVRKESRRN